MVTGSLNRTVSRSVKNHTSVDETSVPSNHEVSSGRRRGRGDFKDEFPVEATRRRRARRVFARLVFVAALVMTSIVLDGNVVFLVPVVFVLVVPFEKLFPRHPGQRIRRPGLVTDLLFAVTSPALGAVSLVVAIVISVLSFVWLPGLALRPVVASIPPPLVGIVGGVLFDLVGYGVHRASHEIGFFWRFHSVHHSSAQLDWISGVRSHPFDGVLLAAPFVFLIAAGFQPEVGGVVAVLSAVTGIFLHANVRFRFRRLQKVVATPEFHHWHHASEPDAIHTNYAPLFPIWDLIFGTFRIPLDRRPSRYGVNEPMPTKFADLLRHPFRRRPERQATTSR